MDLKQQSIKSLGWKNRVAATDCTLIRCMCHDGHSTMRATSPRRHVQHIFRDKETSRGREGERERVEGKGGRERDELFVVSCTLHPRTLTPRYPVYRVYPLPLTVSSIMSATSASDTCSPPRVLFPRKNFTSVSRRNFTRRSFDAQIALFTSQSCKNNYSEMYLDEISSRLAVCYFLAEL